MVSRSLVQWRIRAMAARMLDFSALRMPKSVFEVTPATMAAPCSATGCKGTTPAVLESEKLCVLHYTLAVEQSCAEMRRETVLGKAPHERQLEIIRPQVIITVGRPASQHMLQTKFSMGKLRGQWHEWRGIKLMPTFHPAYVLRSYTNEVRAAVWDDLKKVMGEVGLAVPKRATPS